MENCKDKRSQGQGNADKNDDQMMKNASNPPIKKAKLYHCGTCPYRHNDKMALQKHGEIHKDRGLPLKCQYCPASFSNGGVRKQHEKVHQVATEPKVQLARPTPKTTGTKRTRPQAKHQDESDEDDDVEVRKPVKKSVGRPRQLVPRAAEPVKKSVVGRPGQLVPSAASNELVQHQNVAGASSIARCFNMAMNACAQSTHSNLVTLHDVDIMHGKIGKITLQFQCNECQGRLGTVRCSRGRPYCVTCCGHPECD